jgi:predicted transcriptional regulator
MSGARPPKGPTNELVQTSVRLREDVIKLLEHQAFTENRSKRSIIEEALRDYFAKHNLET